MCKKLHLFQKTLKLSGEYMRHDKSDTSGVIKLEPNQKNRPQTCICGLSV